ncbi:MAG: DNA polymerase III subunit alpha, partial [Aestuariivirgaceae bacterium]
MSDSGPPQSVTFVHLHVHSAYSLSEGALPLARLADLAKTNQMPALAITDTNNLFGALEFSELLAKQGVQPIIGCAIKVDLSEKQADSPINTSAARDEATLVLLAKNETGYLHLMKLSSLVFLNGQENGELVIGLDQLKMHTQGLICLTGGPQGPVNQALVRGQGARARDQLMLLGELFGDRLYVELQRHSAEEEQLAEPGLIDLAYELELPLVATNEAYFATADDFEAHDALLCIAGGDVVSAEDRRRVTPEHYFKSAQEMATLFADVPEAIENTVEIARRCSFRPVSRDPILPKFSTSEREIADEAEELRQQAHDGLEHRLTIHGCTPGYERKDYFDRLEYELGVINKMDFPGYFLIVADFIKWAKSHGIPVGPGRGSGAGSVVAWSLTITDLDPLRFNLIFERFLNPERISMPDFDIDFCQDRRDEVIDYVRQKYGADQVAQIITFGKLQARAVCRDVGRVLQMPYGQVDRLCKLIPNNPANPVSLGQALEIEPRLAEERDRDETVRRMLEIGLKLEGLYRHASTHAAGVVIGDRNLDELVPVYHDPGSPMPVTQFNMNLVEKAGLVKFDFLGLKTLTVLDKAVKLIAKRGIEVDLLNLPLDDKDTFDMLSRAETTGVFQLEGSGMRDLTRKSQPSNIEDIIAIVALYRPGPMENIPKYIACKRGDEQPEVLHDLVTPVVADTYGVIIYQEQVLQIAQLLAGYSLGEADILRKAMGKKIKAEMDQQRERFVTGAVAKGVDETRAEFIFDLVAKFAGYGFNKAHSACYALLAYQTAYLKARYPVELLAASMTLDLGNTDKLLIFRREAQRAGIDIVPPDINMSADEFEVQDGKIFYALSALKNVGRAAVEHIVACRNEGGAFTSIGNFARRIDPRMVNKRALESMAKAGAFDAINPNRAQVLAGVETILGLANRTTAEIAAGQDDLFGGGAGGTGEDIPLPVIEAWLPMDKLAYEFEAIGFYLSGHPLDDYVEPLAKLGVESWAAFQQKAIKKGATAAKLAGTVTYRQERRSRNGNRFAFIGFSDPSGQFETVCFSELLAHARDDLEAGKALIARVEADVEGEEVRLRLVGVEILDAAAANAAQGLDIYVRDATPVTSIVKRLTNGGRARV